MKAEYIIISIVIILIIINYNKNSNDIQYQTSKSIINTPPSINQHRTPLSTPGVIVPSRSIINTSPSMNQYWTPLSTPTFTPDESFILPYDIPNIEIYDDSNYSSILITKNADTVTYTIPNVKVFCGGNVVIIIDKDNIGTDLQYTLPNGSIINPIIDLQSTNKSIYYYAVSMVIDNLNKLIDQFVLTVNKNPIPRLYRNKPIRIEIAYLTTIDRGGAAGLAHHGESGAAIGPSFLMNFFNSCMLTLKNNDEIVKFEQIFTYELCRNYIFPDSIFPILNYNVYSYLDRNNPDKKFTYTYDYSSCVTQGFVNILGGILTLNIKPSVSYSYFSFDLPRMFKMMEDHLDIYINGRYTWDDVFMYDRFIWNEYQSLDNLYSGLLIRLWKTHTTNDNNFLVRFFKAINLMIPERHPKYFQNSQENIIKYTDGNMNVDPDNLRLNSQTAAENFYIASSYGANQDLYNYFTVTLRKSIRPEAQIYAINLINKNQILPVIVTPSMNQFWSPLSTPSYTPKSEFNLPYDVPNIEIFDDTNYDSYIITKNNDGVTKVIPNLKVCCGRKISLIIDKDNVGTDLDVTLSDNSVIQPIFNIQSVNKNKYYYAMAILIDNLDKLIDQFELTVGRIPNPNPYRDKPIRVEISLIDAAGLASHGISGMACGPAFLRDFYNSCVMYIEDNTILPKIDHIFTYELCRNYIFPDQFTPLFDYRLYNLSDRNNNTKTLGFYEWGWVNQGFINVLGGLLTKNIIPSINFDYAGYNIEQFWNMMEIHLDRYINGSIYTWDNTFMYSRMIWTANADNPNGAESLDNIYSGLLIRLWRRYGGKVFLIRFFKAITLMNNRNAYHFLNVVNKLDYIDILSNDITNAKLTVQTAAENLYIAASYGANQDLYTYFTITLKRSIRQEARSYAIALITYN